jgi:hypothetical protein
MLLPVLAAASIRTQSPSGTEGPERQKAIDDVTQQSYVALFDVYGVVQTAAQRPVVDAVRIYADRLLALKEMLDADRFSLATHFNQVALLVRGARHDTIDAMRGELGLMGSARPPEPFDAFLGTPLAIKPGRL